MIVALVYKKIGRSYLVVVESVFDLLAVHVDGIVVILGVHDEASPFPPTGRNVRAVILVQVFAEVACERMRIITMLCVCAVTKQNLPLERAPQTNIMGRDWQKIVYILPSSCASKV